MATDSGRSPADLAPSGSPLLLGPIHAFGSACFFVFGVVYLVFIRSPYMFASNWVFGALCAASWFVLPRRLGTSVRASIFLAIVYLGLVNVAVHVGTGSLPMVFWGMSISIAAAFMFDLPGVLAWIGLAVAFYPLTAWLKQAPVFATVLPLDPSQTALLSVATYLGLMSFLAYTFVLYRRRLDRALRALADRAAALRSSEGFLAQTQRVARVGTYDFDVAGNRWTSSPLLDEIFGIDSSFRRDLQGWASLIHRDDREVMARYVTEEVFGRPDGAFDREYRLARADEGRDVWVHGRGVVIRDAEGRAVRLIGTIQDVSGARRGEEERRHLEAQLFHAQKLESLGILAGGIAHDFNNLLTGMLGNLTVSRTALSAGRTDVDGPLQQAETAALRAAELTRQMLAFSGRGHFVVQPLDLNAILAEMAELLRSSVSKKVAIRFELDPGRPRVLGDGSQVRQVVMNLILNAAEAIGDAPGELAIRSGAGEVAAADLATAVVGAGIGGGRFAWIEVRDTGCGMDAATQARIFEPFFTTKFTGRGLGLAAVLGIVKGHRGAIRLASAPGRGTTFTVLFPPASGEAVPLPATPRSAGPGPAGGVVLVVDDEEAVRGVVRTVLEGGGFRVLEAGDGEAGLRAVRENGDAIDLVLLDLTMPRMGGVEAFAALSALRPGLRVVLMSGYPRGEVAGQFAGAGPADVLEKPFTDADLLAVVRAALCGTGGEGPANGRVPGAGAAAGGQGP